MFKNVTKQKATKETMIKLGRKLLLLREYWQHLLQAYFEKYRVVFKMLLRDAGIILLNKCLQSVSVSSFKKIKIMKWQHNERFGKGRQVFKKLSKCKTDQKVIWGWVNIEVKIYAGMYTTYELPL